jgi:quercetin dioxygenase-like cupin family protein
MKLVCAVAAAALVVVGAASGAAPAPITAQALGLAHVASPFTIKVSKPGDVLFLQAKVLPGGDFGWHVHTSAVAVAVVSGTLTLYDSADPTCAPTRITAGKGFVEQANHVHLARNEGTTPVKLYVAYLGVPHGAKTDVPRATPSQCPSVK